MPTVRVYGQNDGGVNSADNSYANALAGTGTLTTVFNSFSIGQQVAGSYGVYEGFLEFDTTGLGAYTITSAGISFYINTMSSTSNPTAEARLYDYGSSITTADWRTGGSGGTLTGLTLVGQKIFSGMLANTINTIDSVSGAMEANINNSGVTRYVLSTNHVASGTTPVGGSSILALSSSTAGTSQDPYLSLTLTFPTSTDGLLNPFTTLTNSGWVTNTGSTANLYDAINEDTVDDADYIKGSVSGGPIEIPLEGIADPLSATGHIIHVRYKKDISADTVDLLVELLEGTTVRASRTYTNITTTYVTADETLTSTEANSITNYSDLRLRLTPTMKNIPVKVADRATANLNTTVTTVDLVLTGLTVGNVLIIRTAADNSGGGGVARSCTPSNFSGTPISLTTGFQNFQQNNDPGAASAGVTCNLIRANITATSGTVRLTYSGAVVQACVAEEWSNLSDSTGSPDLQSGVASTTLAALSSASAVQLFNLQYCAEAIEGPSSDTYTQDADTIGGASWSTLTKVGTTNATADTNMTTYGGYKIPVTTTSSQNYAPTVSTARDSAGIYPQFFAKATTAAVVISWAQFEVPYAGSTNLVVQSASHATTSTNAVLTQTHILVVQNDAHATSSTVPTVVLVFNLTVQSDVHATTSTVPTLARIFVLVVQSDVHATSASSPTLQRIFILVVQSDVHAMTSVAPTLQRVFILAVDSDVHATTSQNVVLGYAVYSLVVQSDTHATTSEVPTLARIFVLVVQSDVHSSTSTFPTLVVFHILVVQGDLHSTASSNVTLTSAATNLVVQSDTHSTSSTSPTLVVVYILTVQSDQHSVQSTNAVLTQLHLLLVNGASHLEAVSNVVLTQLHILVVQSDTHVENVSAVTLTQTHILVVQSDAHSENVSSVTLTQLHLLVVQSDQHAVQSLNVILTRVLFLAVNSSSHAENVSSVTLTQLHILVVQSDQHSLQSGNVVLAYVHVLLVNAATHAESVSSLTLTQLHVLVVQNDNHAVSSANLLLTQLHVLSVLNATDSITSTHISMAVGLSLIVNNSKDDLTSTNFALIQTHYLITNSVNEALSSPNLSLVQVIALLIQNANEALSSTSPNVNVTSSSLVLQSAVDALVSQSVVLQRTYILVVQSDSSLISSPNLTVQRIYNLLVQSASDLTSSTSMILQRIFLLVVNSAESDVFSEQIVLERLVVILIQNALDVVRSDNTHVSSDFDAIVQNAKNNLSSSRPSLILLIDISGIRVRFEQDQWAVRFTQDQWSVKFVQDQWAVKFVNEPVTVEFKNDLFKASIKSGA